MKYIFYHWFPKPSRSKTEKSKWEKKICLVIEELGSEASCDGTENSRNLDFQRCSRRNRRSRFSHTSSLSNTQSWRKKTEPPSTKMQENICQKEGWEDVAENRSRGIFWGVVFPESWLKSDKHFQGGTASWMLQIWRSIPLSETLEARRKSAKQDICHLLGGGEGVAVRKMPKLPQTRRWDKRWNMWQKLQFSLPPANLLECPALTICLDVTNII